MIPQIGPRKSRTLRRRPKAFIKGSDETNSLGGPPTSDDEYVPSEPSNDVSINDLSEDKESPPPAPPRESPEEEPVSLEELETARRELEALKAQRAQESPSEGSRGPGVGRKGNRTTRRRDV